MKKAKNIKGLSKETLETRINKMMEYYCSIKDNIDNIHVYIASGNTKTGIAVPSVSLRPVIDCGNCKACYLQCYDLRNDICYMACRNRRVDNALVLEFDRKRYFEEINDAVKTFRFFRWHIGGDIKDCDYLLNMIKIAEDNPHCTMLCFTKMFDIVNQYLENNELPENLKIIYSGWIGQEMANPFNMPTSHPIFADGTTSAKDGAKLCTGNCTECAKSNVLCWTLKKGEEVVFPAH